MMNLASQLTRRKGVEAGPATGRPSGFPTGWARRAPARGLRELAQLGVLRPLVHTQVKPVVSGTDVLTELAGPVIFVANHSSHLDAPTLLCSLPDRWRRRTAVAAAADYFFDVWWRAIGSAIVFNAFPIERRSSSRSATPGGLLAQGWNIVVFPEGTRSADGWVSRFRIGAAWLAVEYSVPVVPVGIRGSFAAMPRGRSWPRPGRLPVRVRYGLPVRPGPGETARAFAPRVSAAVAAVLDEDATSWWDSQRRARVGSTPDPTGPAAAPWRRMWAHSGPPRDPKARLAAWDRRAQ